LRATFIHADAGKGARVICDIGGYTFYMRNVVCICPVVTEIPDTLYTLVVKTTGGDVKLAYGGGGAQQDSAYAEAAHRDRAKLTEALAIQSADDEDGARTH